jgi:entericidin A
VKRTIAAFLLASFGILLVGCNTVNGAGQDIQRAGEKLQDASKK